MINSLVSCRSAMYQSGKNNPTDDSILCKDCELKSSLNFVLNGNALKINCKLKGLIQNSFKLHSSLFHYRGRTNLKENGID